LFDFAASPFYTSRTAHDWIPESGRKRRASVSAFGFSGTNAHVVIEEHVPAARPQAGAPQPMIVPLSARTAEQLHTTARDLLAHLEASDAQLTLGDLAYTLQIGRDHMRERCAWVVESLADLQARLQEFVLVPGALPGCHRGSVARSSDAGLRTREAAERRLQDGARQTGELAALWAEGADIDWNSFYSGTRPRRVSRLPSYPFAKERYWPQQAAPVAAPKKPEGEIVVAKEQKRPTCYVPDWQVAPLSSQRVPLAKGDTLLIVDSDDLLFEQVRARLHVASPLDAIVLVRLADAYGQDATDRFSVDASQPRHFEMLLEALRGQGRFPSHVIHNADAARLFQHGVAHQVTHEAAEGAMRAGIDALSGLCRALAGAGAGQSPCAFVSYFHEDAAADTAGCQALAAFYRSLALENNRYQGRVLALDHQGLDPATSVVDTVTCILDELQSPRLREVEVRYECSGKAAAHRLARVLAERRMESAGAGEPSLKQGGVYLITGGLGGLGYLFARHLAEHYRAKLILSGRSGLSGAGEEQLGLLRRLGADAIYVLADIADQSQVDDLIAGARVRFGGLNGVIHSAGVSDDALLIRKDHEAFRKVLAPKVQGTLNLDRATASEPLDLFVMFSSGAGTFGNAGQSDYAYANAYMDAFAERRQSLCARRERFGKTLSIGWPYWQEGGMQVSAADLQQIEGRTGLCALPTDTGIAYFEALLGSEPSRALALYGFPSRIDAHCRPPITAVATTPAVAAAIDHEALPLLTHAYLCGLVHAETKIPVDRIDINERFEAFGFDSIMIGRFNAALEQDLGELPKTLMYEYETVAELAAYLCKAVAPALARKLTSDAVIAHPVANTSASSPPSAASELDWPQEQPPHADAEPIAIIGVHASFPQSEDMNALWGHLQSGNDLIQLVPETRWNHAEFYHPDPNQAENGKIYCKWGGFLENFDRFDAGFFNIPETEAAIIDPQERCFLQSAWAAVEDAGYTRERLKQLHPKGKSADVGVFVGVTTNSYQLLAPEAWQRGQMVTPSAMPWSIANRVSYCMDFQGPSLPVDTACSSSLVAVHLACESLRRRECAVALAGGVNLYLHPAKYQSFCQRRMLAEGDQCRSYGNGTDGFIPGEGVGTLVLKPLRLAERDGDHIYGVICGSAFDHSGRSNGYATPNPKAQANVIAQALAQSGVPARSIGFIEGHGTGTRMGDSLEIAAITQAFSQHTTDTHFCALASLKANIGHAESATSIAGIAKILMQFKHRQIAPSIHAEVVNPDIDFANSPCVLQTRLSSWEAPDGHPRRALINAFGAGGVNACAVLEEYVAAEPAIEASAGGPCLFVVSAMSTDRLREYVGRHVGFLEANPGGDIEAVCFTMQVGREAMPERLALLVDSVAQLREKLLMWLDAPATLPAAQLWQSTPESRTAIARTASEQHERALALCQSRDLSGLASLWVQGGRVEWQRLHKQRARLVGGLPVYPFAQQRHWVTDIAAKSRPAVVQAGLSRLHPLVSHNSSTLERVRFDAVLDHDQYYAREHRLNGTAVFPGAGFVEMACVAATVAGQRRVREVRDIFWVHPLAVSESQQDLRISLLNAVGDCAEFVVTTVDDDHETVVHCEGRAVFHDGTSRVPLRPSLPEWKQRCGKPHDGERYYGMFRRLGFDYGPAFRTIKEVSIGDGCALARLELDHAQSQDFDQYLLHP
ncbi:MAG: SDR family NAD(P)-dependent oxidoreductase, partial [Pseudomonadota bacterium]|nr:SDR family NAD(P)-dependent oxidoreductase [Pseudomonadota bacterium]